METFLEAMRDPLLTLSCVLLGGAITAWSTRDAQRRELRQREAARLMDAYVMFLGHLVALESARAGVQYFADADAKDADAKEFVNSFAPQAMNRFTAVQANLLKDACAIMLLDYDRENVRLVVELLQLSSGEWREIRDNQEAITEVKSQLLTRWKLAARFPELVQDLPEMLKQLSERTDAPD